jgi:hypothetical protein
MATAHGQPIKTSVSVNCDTDPNFPRQTPVFAGTVTLTPTGWTVTLDEPAGFFALIDGMDDDKGVTLDFFVRAFNR